MHQQCALSFVMTMKLDDSVVITVRGPSNGVVMLVVVVIPFRLVLVAVAYSLFVCLLMNKGILLGGILFGFGNIDENCNKTRSVINRIAIAMAIAMIGSIDVSVDPNKASCNLYM